MGEKKRSSLVLRHAAQELPAHQRVQLGILVDRAVDSHQQALRLEVGQMVLEIEPRPAAALQLGTTRGGRLIEHLELRVGRETYRIFGPDCITLFTTVM